MAAIDVISLVDEGLDNSRTCLTSAMARRWLHTRTSICGRALQRSDAGYGSPTPRTPTCTPTSSSAGSGWVAAWPTHGAGSFCSAPPGAERTSTIGATLATNTPIDAESEDALGSFPPYFLRLGIQPPRTRARLVGTPCDRGRPTMWPGLVDRREDADQVDPARLGGEPGSHLRARHPPGQ